MLLSLLTAVFLFVVLVGLLLACIVMARRVVYPGPPRSTPVELSSDGSFLSASAHELSVAPGRYGVWFSDGAGHAVVGDVRSLGDGTVVRDVLRVRGNVPSCAVDARWSGHVFDGPDALDIPWSDVKIPTPSGTCPAWLFPGDGDPSTAWAVHIHGRATGRVTALRSVPSANRAGLTSLVVSFRGDGEGPTDPNAPSDLGASAWQDVEHALHFAVEKGATSIILYGWSMGAAIALRLAERSHHRARVSGLVLIGPVTSWRRAVAAGAARLHLPRLVGTVVTTFLQTRLGARAVKSASAYPLIEMDWTRRQSRLDHNALVIHSAGDLEVPLSSSHAFAEQHGQRVDLVEFAPVPHCMEWNAEPDRFERVVADWVTRRIDSPIQD